MDYIEIWVVYGFKKGLSEEEKKCEECEINTKGGVGNKKGNGNKSVVSGYEYGSEERIGDLEEVD